MFGYINSTILGRNGVLRLVKIISLVVFYPHKGGSLQTIQFLEDYKK